MGLSACCVKCKTTFPYVAENEDLIVAICPKCGDKKPMKIKGATAFLAAFEKISWLKLLKEAPPVDGKYKVH